MPPVHGAGRAREGGRRGTGPAKIAEGFGVEASNVTNETTVAESIATGMDIVQRENRPYLLNVHLPMGLPQGGRPGSRYNMSDSIS